MEHHTIKATMTAHGFNDWSEAHKVCYLIKVINTNIVDTCLSNISMSEVLCDDFSAAERHVANFLAIMNSPDPGSNRNISSVDTDQVGAAVRGVEENLDAEDKVGEAEAVVGEGDMEYLPRIWLTLVPISPSPITLWISKACSVLHRSRRFGIKKVNSL